jgi:phage recombination protein Bet
MSGSGSALAVRDSVPAGALAIEEGQTGWKPMQLAALDQLGIKNASDGDKAVFLHVSQRTGLDPFAKQIMMIGRNEWDPAINAKRMKWSIQTGIEGFRVIRHRAERLEGVRGILSRPVYYDAEGKEHKVWFQRIPPVAVEMTYTVRDRNGVETPYTSILRFKEYEQTNQDGNPIAQWKSKPVHMLEKCVEADVYRKTFPQDFSGVQLDDAMPPADPDDAPAQPARERVTADQLRNRAGGTDWQGHAEHGARRLAEQDAAAKIVDAVVVDEQDVSPAADQPAAAPPAAAENAAPSPVAQADPAAGEATPPRRQATSGQQTAQLAGITGTITSTGDLDPDQAAQVLTQLRTVTTSAELEALLKTGEKPGE